MDRVFAPGCALMIYKPELARKVLNFLQAAYGNVGEHLTCCRHEPHLPAGTQIINTCAGCDRRYRELYEGITSISLWELLKDSDVFCFPDYGGQQMTVLDACPTRDQDRIHDAVRALLARMNIRVAEPAATRKKGVCCGDSFFGILPVDAVKQQMKIRADQMPCEDVVVYCISCCKAMHIGGKKPRYLLDLLFQESTTPGTFEPEQWHGEIDEFICTH